MSKTIYRKPGKLEIVKGWDFCYKLSQYHQERTLIISLIFFTFYISLPDFKNYDTSIIDRSWGIYYHERSLWLCRGSKIKSIDMPWQWAPVYDKIKMENGEWEDSKKLDTYRKNGFKLWKSNYLYKLKNGDVQSVEATIYLSKYAYCWKWCKWLGFPTKKGRTIDVTFSKPIGEEVDSWKGGCIECGYILKKNETPIQGLRRMEKERKF